MDSITQTLLQILINTVLVSGIIAYFINKREERMKKTIEEEFSKRDIFFNAQFNFKQRCVEELLGPVMMQLKRSSQTLDAYEANSIFREAILKQCNTNIRDLLLLKAYLIPSDLLADAGEFLKHYDGWLEAYHQIRELQQNEDTPFIFTYNFPHDAEANFKNKYEAYRKELKIENTLN